MPFGMGKRLRPLCLVLLWITAFAMHQQSIHDAFTVLRMVRVRQPQGMPHLVHDGGEKINATRWNEPVKIEAPAVG